MNTRRIDELNDESKRLEIRLRVKGMTCDDCAMHVARALERVDGVNRVKIPNLES